MANTVDLNNIQEFSDRPRVLVGKIEEVADLIRHSKHCILFTGAGISTSASIPDFRGPNGVWTRQAQGGPTPDCINLVQAIPTECHNFIKEGVQNGTFKYVVSQNVDGLHRRSGIPRDKISELHGNTFLEICWNCGADYEHDFEVQGGMNQPKTCRECHPRVPHFCHCSGRKCARCDSNLKDSIIHFGENLPKQALVRAYEEADKADLCIVFGSSLTVSPANEIPARVARSHGGKLVIVNLQKTDLDEKCHTRIFANTDEVSTLLRTALDRKSSSSFREQEPKQEEEEEEDTASTIPHNAGVVPRRVQQPQPQTRIRLGNWVHKESEDSFLWTVYVQKLSGTRDISSVKYKLHPTFSPSEITVSEPKRDGSGNLVFPLQRSGWGTFDVLCTITFSDGSSVVDYPHALSFNHGGAHKELSTS